MSYFSHENLSKEDKELFGRWAFGPNYAELVGGMSFMTAWNALHSDLLKLDVTGQIYEDLPKMVNLWNCDKTLLNADVRLRFPNELKKPNEDDMNFENLLQEHMKRLMAGMVKPDADKVNIKDELEDLLKTYEKNLQQATDQKDCSHGYMMHYMERYVADNKAWSIASTKLQRLKEKLKLSKSGPELKTKPEEECDEEEDDE